MMISLATIVMAQLAALGLCAPGVEVRGQKGTFSLTQVKNSNFRGVDAPTALIDAYAKYGKPIPKTMLKAMQMNPDLDQKFKNRLATGSGTVTASVPNYPAPFYDSQYVVPVQIGTPAQTIYLNLDTGSADLWVFSTDTNPQSVRGQTLYRPKQSSTSKRLNGQTWSVLYGDGSSAGGIVYTDKVSVGGTSFPNQAVQAAVQVSAAIAGDPFSSGILGMGRSSANTVRPTMQKTYIENIQSSLRETFFTVDLKSQQPGTYDFGYIDRTKYIDRIQWVWADPYSPYWEFTVDGYKIDRNSKQFRPYRFQAIVDTGTTLMLLPTGIVNDYYSKVKGATFDPYSGMMVFPCATSTPDFVIGLGKYRGVVPGKYMNYGKSNSTHCYGGIQDSDGIGFAIMGDVFLKAQFVVFDVGKGKLGFANKKIS